MAVTVKMLTAANANRWDRAKIKPASKASFASVAKKLVAAKDRYQAIEDETGVPWFVIAVIHQRESSQRWNRSLAQGDPWNKKSTHVPKGRGPFKSFEDAAVDALKNCAPYAARWKDWSPGGTMTLLEHYNGLGYANRGLPSPYIWSGTDQYVKGKYVADGKFSATEVDKQLGCAGLIMAMQDLDASISFDGEEVSDSRDSTAVAPAGIEVASADDTFVPELKEEADVVTVASAEDVVPAHVKPATKAISAETIMEVQKNLLSLGYHEVSAADGLWGSKTAAGIAAYKNDKKLPGAPIIDDDLIAALEASVNLDDKRLIPTDRASVTAKALAPSVPAVRQTLRARFWAAVGGIGAIFTGGIDWISKHIDSAREYIQPFTSFFRDVPGWMWWVGVAGVLLYFFVSSGKVNDFIVHDKKTNRLN